MQHELQHKLTNEKFKQFKFTYGHSGSYKHGK